MSVECLLKRQPTILQVLNPDVQAVNQALHYPFDNPGLSLVEDNILAGAIASDSTIRALTDCKAAGMLERLAIFVVNQYHLGIVEQVVNGLINSFDARIQHLQNGWPAFQEMFHQNIRQEPALPDPGLASNDHSCLIKNMLLLGRDHDQVAIYTYLSSHPAGSLILRPAEHRGTLFIRRSYQLAVLRMVWKKEIGTCLKSNAILVNGFTLGRVFRLRNHFLQSKLAAAGHS
jgi:hypothetical protein